MLAASLRLILALGLSAAALLGTDHARAQVPVAAPRAESGEAGARKHFERALELYRAGNYAKALEELKRSAELDPRGKDLFFNLALVQEKLGQLPEAITSLERFRELETDPAERERARISIERLRGAAEAKQAESAPPTPCPVSPPPVVVVAKAPNGLLIGSASVAVAALVVGTVFGLKALSDDVNDARTSPTLSIDQFRQRARRAEREALVADVALALGLASTATFISVWWLTPQEPSGARGAGLTLRSYF